MSEIYDITIVKVDQLVCLSPYGNMRQVKVN